MNTARGKEVGFKTKPHQNWWIYPLTTSFYKTAWSPTIVTPTLQYFYTDISAISVTFCNSGPRYAIHQIFRPVSHKSSTDLLVEIFYSSPPRIKGTFQVKMQNSVVDNKQNMTYFRAERKDYPNPVQFHHKTHFLFQQE